MKKLIIKIMERIINPLLGYRIWRKGEEPVVQ